MDGFGRRPGLDGSTTSRLPGLGDGGWRLSASHAEILTVGVGSDSCSMPGAATLLQVALDLPGRCSNEASPQPRDPPAPLELHLVRQRWRCRRDPSAGRERRTRVASRSPKSLRSAWPMTPQRDSPRQINVRPTERGRPRLAKGEGHRPPSTPGSLDDGPSTSSSSVPIAKVSTSSHVRRVSRAYLG